MRSFTWVRRRLRPSRRPEATRTTGFVKRPPQFWHDCVSAVAVGSGTRNQALLLAENGVAMTHEQAGSKSPGAPTPAAKPRAKPEKQDRQRLNAVIAGHVMGTLGRPPDLHSVQVRRLW